MGGGALKKLPKDKQTRRYNKDEFDSLATKLLPKVKDVFNTEVTLVESYKDKQTFGDMDILVLNNGLGIDFENNIDFVNQLKEIVVEEFGANQTHKNGNVLSFDYERLQIDLILVDKENWESSNIFYKWGDLGNFMGKLFSSYGNLDKKHRLKYGFDGLKVVLLYNHRYKEVILTKDNKKGFDFLGLDYERYEQGFNSNKDVFDYILTSDIYSYDIFQWENLNSKNKFRNKRRPSYYEFLEYIKDKKNTIEYTKGDDYYLNELKDFFSVDIKEEYDSLLKESERKKEISEKFNGRHVLNKFEVNPKKLNGMFGNFKKYVSENKGDYGNYILGNKLENLLSDFKQSNDL